MKNNYLLLLLLIAGFSSARAQDKTVAVPKSQFIFIIRSKTDLSMYSKDSIQINIKHWQAFMGGLASNGKIAAGFMPGGDGTTITGTDKQVKKASYVVNNETVSSFLIINAANANEAQSIAKKCPVLELGGSVEIRPVTATAN
jgi:hypothetical protein